MTASTLTLPVSGEQDLASWAAVVRRQQRITWNPAPITVTACACRWGADRA
jgi:hypothetical protein